ncbi:hypothetical protein [Nocardia brasiliensis]|uniref:hypothetical protein n=1 Tax=Nocardia brasiliensis TaxID=37326 RepID=UPI00366B6378
MKRIVANSVVVGAIAVGTMIGAGQAAAQHGLPLEPAVTAPDAGASAAQAAPVRETGTGSAEGLSKLATTLATLSGNAPCGPGGKPATGSEIVC